MMNDNVKKQIVNAGKTLFESLASDLLGGFDDEPEPKTDSKVVIETCADPIMAEPKVKSKRPGTGFFTGDSEEVAPFPNNENVTLGELQRIESEFCEGIMLADASPSVGAFVFGVVTAHIIDRLITDGSNRQEIVSALLSEYRRGYSMSVSFHDAKRKPA
jgi:hypothetical protein